jgi:biotin carboxyl carrier protein
VRYLVTIDGREHTLEITHAERLECALDGIVFRADVAEVRPGVYSVLIGERSFAARVHSGRTALAAGARSSNGRATNGGEYVVQVDGASFEIAAEDPRRRRRAGTRLAVEGKQIVKAPMPGKVVRVLVAEGQAVEAGQGLLVIEAMKMQNEVKCPKAGKIAKLAALEGQAVKAGETLAVVE